MISLFLRPRKLLMAIAAVLLVIPLVCFSTASASTTTTRPPPSFSNLTGPDIPPEVTQYAADWPLPNKDYANTRATTESAINSGNVDTIGVAWAVPLPGAGIFGGASTMPVIMGDTAYIQDLSNNVFAIDMETGDIKWQALHNSSNIGPNGIAVGYGKVFGSSDPYNIVALDMNTGERLWQTQVSVQPTSGVDIQPGLYGGLVYVSTVPGTSGGDFYAGGGIGIIHALDQETGEIVWSFNTIDSEDIWGNPEVNSGGGSWYPPAVDTATGMMYWAIANPAPWPGTPEFPNGSSRPGDNLYTNSIVSLDAFNGEMAWYTQVRPHDIFDLDLQCPPILTTASINGDEQEIVIGSGKLGTIYAFDRYSGQILWSTDVGRHENDDLTEIPEGETVEVYPGFFGGVETPMAYADGKVFASVVNIYTEYSSTNMTGSESIADGTGNFVALDVNTGEILWDNELDIPGFAGATVINDLVFTATFDGMMYAYNIDTGEEVWKWQAPGPINAWPSAAGDKLLVPVGLATPFPVLIALKLNSAAPALAMLPLDGQSIETGNITVSAMAFNIELTDDIGGVNAPGEGHLIYYMDAEIPSAPGQAAIPVSGIYSATANTSYTFPEAGIGTHTFSVQMVNNDNTPLDPPLIASATVNITAPLPTITITSPVNNAILPLGDVTIEIDVSNFELVGNPGSTNEEGKGHIIYYMDVVAPTLPGEPAITDGGSSVSTSAASNTWVNVPAGTHTFFVQLVNNDNTPLSQPVISKVVVRVETGAGGGGP